MKAIIKGVLDRPVTVIVSIIALVVFFITALSSITLKLMPSMSIPMMLVATAYPGATPEDVDELVSDKVSNACQSLTGIKAIECDSAEGMSQVLLQYEYGQDMDKAYNDVREAVEAIKNQFPTAVIDPVYMEIDTDAIDDITLSITGKSDDVDVLTMVNDKVVPDLKKLSDVAQTTVRGGDEKYIQVQVIPEYMLQYGLDVGSLASAISAANFTMATGTADYGDQSLALSAEVKYDTIPTIEQIPITTSKGQTIHLNDVAKVRYAVSDKSSLSRYKGMENVSLSIKRRQSSSSVDLSRQVIPELELLREEYPELNIEVQEDAADTILDTLKGVAKTMMQAVLLAMIIIFVFFGDIKGSLIVGSTMPISIMATIILMQRAGFALDVITMAALIIAVGMMTDNAVVVIEMCFRRHQAGLSFKDAAYEGTSIVANAVTGSTITTVVVYAPLAFMEGLSGQMFKPLASTIIFALLSSLISALTLIPLCFNIYKPVEKREIITNKILRKVSKIYRRVLRKALKRKKTVVLIAVLILGISVYLATFLKTELFSGTDEGIVSISMQFRPNLSLEAMDDTVKQMEQFVASSDVIEKYSSSISKSDANASVYAYKKDDTKLTTQQIVDEWNEEMRNFSTICEVRISAGSTTGMDQMSTASSKQYAIKSSDLDKLTEVSKKVVKAMEDTEGVLYTTSELNDTGTKAMVVIDPVMASARGFSAKQLASTVYTNMAGSKACDVTIDGTKFEVRAEYPDDLYENISDVQAMTFINSKGETVPLSEVGEVKFASAPSRISRQDGLYINYVTATTTTANRDQVAENLDEKVNAIVMDNDVSFVNTLSDRMMQEEFTAIIQAIFIAIFLVFFVMTVQFESIANSLLIMLCVPFSGIGAILFMLVMGIKVSMVSLMGILMLSGIVVNNGIILIDMTIQNQKAGMETVEALVDAGSGRLRPILMTTLTTVIAMIPVALGWSKDAMAMQGMAAVIVGGLTASTVLTLVLLPTFYLILDRIRARHTARQERRRIRQEQKVQDQETLLKEKERENSRVNLVFPMGGAGTRFLDNGFECPKPLIDLAGEPFFKRAADSLVGHLKYERLVFVVLEDHIRRFEIDKKIHEYYPDAKIVALKKVLPGAVMTAMEGAKHVRNGLPVIFTDCDLLFTSDEMYEFYRSGAAGADGSLLTFKSDKDKYSYVELNDKGFASRTAEKEVISENAITGSYGFANASLFLDMAERYLKNCPYDEYYMSGVYNELISSGRKVRVFGVDTYMSFGTPDEYENAEKTLASQQKDAAEEAEDKAAGDKAENKTAGDKAENKTAGDKAGARDKAEDGNKVSEDKNNAGNKGEVTGGDNKDADDNVDNSGNDSGNYGNDSGI
ncbi:MAG: efflux RND transporter permease subunit [Lachnospiraceae bacterium]|nr:efflux RND transporter permease subunit [Lachnospiraceae bacterium]